MPIAAGTMNQRVQFRRRTAGAYQDHGLVQWAEYRFERPVTISHGGMNMQGKGGRLAIRDSELARSLSTGDRVRMDGEEYAITIVKRREMNSEDVRLEIETAASAGLYAAEMDRRGEIVTVQRVRAGQPPLNQDARAIVTGYQPDELLGGAQQGDRRIFLLASDLEGGAIPLPLQTAKAEASSLRIIVRGRTLAVIAIDDNTHRVGGELYAYDITARG